ncbi:MAG: hypothetical protein DMD42_04425 [Gemmatimonadetes bacterium]|nr:MAG: hypothetical protein DMD42_04425 [Gemmatimonadota bacterium]
MRLGVALALAACLALPLAAQSVRGRLEGRIPSAAIPAVDSLIQLAEQEGLPTEPLVQKALEGGAKHVAESRIVAAVQLSLGQLRDARDLLVRAGDQPPVVPAELTTVAWALRRGLPAAVIERVVVALGPPPRAAAMHAVADLVAHQFDPDSAADLIIEAVQQGVLRERLLDVSTAALHQVQRGHTRAEALAIVRRQLPNLPAPSKPTRGNVAGARRPATPAP